MQSFSVWALDPTGAHAPGRSILDAMTRLADTAAHRIADGALDGRKVAHLADELFASERHLRRSLERSVGASPTELVQTHRLRTAERLLAETTLSVTRIAFASGFQSLRRFNAVVREHYGRTATELRRALTFARAGNGRDGSDPRFRPAREVARNA